MERIGGIGGLREPRKGKRRMDNNLAEELAKVAGIIVAVSLVLVQVLGGLLMYLVEALKATGKIKEGWSGLIAIVLGIGLGMGLAAITDSLVDNSPGMGPMLAIGAFAGAMMAAGAVKTFKAVGDVNPTVKVESAAPVTVVSQGDPGVH